MQENCLVLKLVMMLMLKHSTQSRLAMNGEAAQAHTIFGGDNLPMWDKLQQLAWKSCPWSTHIVMVKIEQVFLHVILKAMRDYLLQCITLTLTVVFLGLITRVIISTEFRVHFNVLFRKVGTNLIEFHYSRQMWLFVNRWVSYTWIDFWITWEMFWKLRPRLVVTNFY